MSRNIREIAPLLANHYVDFEIEPGTLERKTKLITENAQRLGLYHKYLGQLHDSWFMSTSIAADKLLITLNDFATHVFADVIVDQKNLSIVHDKLVFPLLIEFEITNLSFNTVDEDGFIESMPPTNINEYIDEEIIAIDEDKIDIGLVVWKNGINDQRGQEILILMSVKSFAVTELQGKAWNDIFGTGYDDYYEYFKSQRNTGRDLSDQSICNKLYHEFEAERKR